MADADAKRITTTATITDTQRLPPRRGRVKIRIFKSIAAALSCSGRRKKQKDGGEAALYPESAGSEWLSFRQVTPEINDNHDDNRHKKQKEGGEGSYYLSSISTTPPVSGGYPSDK